MRTTELARAPRKIIFILAVVVGLASISEGRAALGVDILTAPASKLWLEGNSTLHKYRADAKQWQASVALAGSAAGDLESIVQNHQVAGMTVTVAVAGLHSGEGGLDDNMAKALEGKAHSQIVYRMVSYTTRPASGDGAFTIVAQGKLKVAGRERNVTIDAQVTRTPDGLRLVGSVPFRMSDFGVKAPVLMLGMIKTDDQVVIGFDLQLQARP